MSKTKELIEKDEVIQAVLIADNFNDEFSPITNDLPLALLPLVNRPLIDYSLESLALGGIQETFLFCSSHADVIKEYLKNTKSVWSHKMKVNIIVSESCRSLGDCLRDLDAKGLIRGSFVLAEPGVIANIKLLPIIKKHNEIAKHDKGAAMTLILEEAGMGQFGRCCKEEILVASNPNKRILFLQKLGMTDNKKINFPLDIFLENSNVSIQHNLKDTHLAICSPSVLPLFSDNFDYQTRDDFVKCLLIIDEVLDSTIYCHTIKGSQHGAAVSNWRMYQAISKELIENWMHPISPHIKGSRGIIAGKNCKISPQNTQVKNVIMGDNVHIGDNVTVSNSFILSNTKIEEYCVINDSIIGSDVIIGKGSSVVDGSVIGNHVLLKHETKIENKLIQSTKPDFCEELDKLSERAFQLELDDDDDDELRNRFSRLRLLDKYEVPEDEEYESSESEDDMSYTNSPIPDDAKVFFSEVTDSLARGIEDKLQCDNLILEINSSRYAYNVTLKEVTFNVIKAILNLPFQQSNGQPYLQALSRCLLYFSPIIKNYIQSEDAMGDCLHAIEDVATENSELNDCISKILNWFYDKDYISEEVIVCWYEKMDKGSRLCKRIEPFIKWLQEAEEASSSGEEESD